MLFDLCCLTQTSLVVHYKILYQHFEFQKYLKKFPLTIDHRLTSFACLFLISIICACVTKEQVAQKDFSLGTTKCQQLSPYPFIVLSDLEMFVNDSLNCFPYNVVEVTHVTLNIMLCYYCLKSW